MGISSLAIVDVYLVPALVARLHLMIDDPIPHFPLSTFTLTQSHTCHNFGSSASPTLAQSRVSDDQPDPAVPDDQPRKSSNSVGVFSKHADTRDLALERD